MPLPGGALDPTSLHSPSDNGNGSCFLCCSSCRKYLLNLQGGMGTQNPPTKATEKQHREPPLDASRLMPWKKPQLLACQGLGPQTLCLPECLVIFPILGRMEQP